MAFHTSKQAPRCGVDDKYFHDVAHNKSRQDEQRREDFSPSSAPKNKEFCFRVAETSINFAAESGVKRSFL